MTLQGALHHETYTERLLWVISGNGVTPASCPFFPSKQTFVSVSGRPLCATSGQ